MAGFDVPGVGKTGTAIRAGRPNGKASMGSGASRLKLKLALRREPASWLRKLWPERAADFQRVKDDGRAESALIARHFITREGFK